MIREKNIIINNSCAINTRPTTVKPTRQTVLRRIENENEQLRVQKDVLKSALQNITVNIKIGESAFDHIDKMKRLAVEALDELAALESKSNSS